MNHTEYMREYRKTPNGKKSHQISNWKSNGLVGDYELIYSRYINTTNCDDCNILLTTDGKSITTKCMDHNHTTNEFRNILCKNCNSKKRENQKNFSGHRGIYFVKTRNLWIYQKRYNGKNIYQKRSKSKTKILCIKFAYLILFNHRHNVNK